jgi:hypothetical protein
MVRRIAGICLLALLSAGCGDTGVRPLTYEVGGPDAAAMAFAVVSQDYVHQRGFDASSWSERAVIQLTDKVYPACASRRSPGTALRTVSIATGRMNASVLGAGIRTIGGEPATEGTHVYYLSEAADGTILASWKSVDGTVTFDELTSTTARGTFSVTMGDWRPGSPEQVAFSGSFNAALCTP